MHNQRNDRPRHYERHDRHERHYDPTRRRRSDNFNNNARRRSTKGGPIPDRWLNYIPVCREVIGSRFVPFKTPLHKRVFEHRKPDQHFHVEILLDYAREAGHSIGLVIDLTNTDRYYDKSVWEANNVLYEKIRCPGHEIHERDDVVEKFFSVVDQYFDEHNDASLVGVHCTHGINRTGYLICRYLIERQGWTANDAIECFGECRGYGIERPNYIAKLKEIERKREADNDNDNNEENAAARSDRDKDLESYGNSTEEDSEIKNDDTKRAEIRQHSQKRD